MPDNACLLPAISRFDIAFGFGDSSIGAICQNNNVDTDTFICVCNLISGYEYNTDSISITSLMGYLKRAHASLYLTGSNLFVCQSYYSTGHFVPCKVSSD